MASGSKVIKAIDIVRCIRSGLTDAELMEKFGVSAKGLQNAFKQLESQGILVPSEMERRALLAPASVSLDVERPRSPADAKGRVKVSASQVLKDIRAGMDDTGLMKKYRLSARGLQSLFGKLVEMDLLDLVDLERSAESNFNGVVLDDDAESRFDDREPEEEIKTAELLERIESGADRDALMAEYDLSSTNLQGVLKNLVSGGRISQTELERRLPWMNQHFRIKHRFSGKLIYSGQASSMAALVVQAVSSGVSLAEADLSSANLARAELSGARLHYANLRKANLVRADLTGARLEGADLSSADMTAAILFKANLSHANLSDAGLAMINGRWAFFSGANLSEANLTKANLSGANLSDANVFEAILAEANLTGAFLQNVDIGAAKTPGAIW